MEYKQPMEEDRVARLKAELGQMSNKEKERLAQELGGTLEEDTNQDFLSVLLPISNGVVVSMVTKALVVIVRLIVLSFSLSSVVVVTLLFS
jgi:hypothetical protein